MASKSNNKARNQRLAKRRPSRLDAAMESAMAPAKPAVRNDGWLNILTGLGTSTYDKRVAASVEWCRITETEAEELYAGDELAAAVVDTLPEEAFREWLTFHSGSDEDAADDTLAEDMEAVLDGLGARQRLIESWKFGRLYGGGALFLNVDDGLQLDQPLDFSRIRAVRALVPMSRWELMTTTQDVDLDFTSPRYGQPKWYRFQPRRGGANGVGTRIHHSRILRFDGAKLPIRLFITNGYWHDSVLTRARNAIRNYAVSHDAASTVLQEFQQGVFKMKGLAEMIQNGQDQLVIQRLQVAQLGRSVCRALVLDADESYENVGAALSGVDALLTKVEGRLTVATRMPHTKILGESPSGLGATGESENRDWYDFVASQREAECWHKVRYLLHVILASRKGPTGGQVPEKWGFEFNPLWQMDEAQQADIRNKQAQTDQIYISTQVLDPAEVAVSRFGTGKWSPETRIDKDARSAGDDLDGAPADPDGDGDELEGARAEVQQ